MKKLLLSGLLVLLFASPSYAQKLDVSWTSGICSGVCNAVVGYNVYVGTTKVDVGVGVPDPSVPDGMKTLINLTSTPLTDVTVYMTAYDSSNNESAQSNSIVIKASEWVQPVPAPVIIRVTPVLQ